MAKKELPPETYLPHPAYPQVPGESTLEKNDPVFVEMEEDDTGYSVEDAYRVLAGMPLSPVETTPVE